MFVGIDVAKAELFVREAIGGYELLAVAALAAAALPVVVVNPRQGRDFAKATGKLELRRTKRQRSISRIHRIGQCEIFSCSIDFMKLAFSVFRRVFERSN
jgi:transposase